MARRRHQIKVNELSGMLVYMLAHRPAEFGIVPSRDGFVPFKELLKALHEEPGWRYVRQSHINEVLLGKDRFLFETESGRIRTVERKWEIDFEDGFLERIPSILFAPIRRRAHPVVMEKGLIPAPGRLLVLTPDESMARRIGQRQDPKPVLLQVEAEKARKEGISFSPFDTLYLCRKVPARYIAGPPVAKEMLKVAGEKEAKPIEEIRLADAFSAGTFPLDLARDPAPHRREKGKKKKGWKESARKMRRKRK
ncbi:MAG: RNA 2'-phosphotransferase [Deltaproteobacteria bacterium]|nr:RNA 2'-phosphotransferase [Deltaproteobacteria bacterium]